MYLLLLSVRFAETGKPSGKEVVMHQLIASKGEVDECGVRAAGLLFGAAALFLGDYHEC